MDKVFHALSVAAARVGPTLKTLQLPRILKSRIYVRYSLLLLLICLVTFLVVEHDSKKKLRPYHQNLHDGPSTCKNSVAFRCDECVTCAIKGSKPAPNRQAEDWEWSYKKDAYNFALTDAQCAAAFTGLYHHIDSSVASFGGRNITSDDIAADLKAPGSIHAVIQDGQLYIHNVTGDPKNKGAFRSRTIGILSSLHRALSASPEPHRIPNIQFTMTVQDSTLDAFRDKSNRPIWAFTRRQEDDLVWLMPDYGSWQSKELHIASYAEARLRIEEVESQYKNRWKQKWQNLFWRGQVYEAEKLRGDLMRTTLWKDWSDVQALDKYAGRQAGDHAIEDYCRHTFLAVAEGRSYATRLRYLQNCRSVIVTHRSQWITTLSHLMIAAGPAQNYVQVERDWSNLAVQIIKLKTNLDMAEKIATRSREVFGERYGTPAAEACYWRRLIEGWAKVTEPYQPYEEDMRRRWRGIAFETWLIRGEIDWPLGT